MLSHYACIGQHRHEVRIPVPAGYDMEMDVSFDACASGSAEVEAGICAMRLERPIEYLERPIEQLPELGPLHGVHLSWRGEMAVRRNQDVPVRIRIEIEDHEAGRPAVQDQLFLIVGVAGGRTEHAFERIVSRCGFDELQPPWCPDTFHTRSVPRAGRARYARAVAPVPDIQLLAKILAPTLAVPAPEATASVMICLRNGERGTEILLCRRATRAGDPWSGHVGLPGGRVEEVDRDALDTAARETWEEVGFDPREHGSILGALEPLTPRSFAIVISAYVAHITDSVELTLSEEIAAAWWTPFVDLELISAEVPEAPTRVSAYRLPHADAADVVVWGITYRLLDRLFGITNVQGPNE